MPDIPEFEERLPDIHPVGAPEASPGAMAEAGGALAAGGAKLSSAVQEFTQRYWEARNTTAASNAMTRITQGAGDAEHKFGLMNDRVQALAGWDKYEKDQVDAINADPSLNMHSRAVVLSEAQREFASRRIAVSDQAFRREASTNVADLIASRQVLSNQYAQAVDANNPALMAQLKGRWKAMVEADVHLGYLEAAEGENQIKQFNSEASQNEVRAIANSYRAKLDDKGLDGLEAKLSNTANYPDMLENERNALRTEITTWSWKVAAKRQAMETKALQASLRTFQDNEYALRMGLPEPHPMNDNQIYALASATGQDPHVLLDQYHHMRVYNQARQATATTSLGEDQATLAALQDPRKGVAAAAPGTPAFKMEKAAIEANIHKFNDFKQAVEDKNARLNADPVGYLMENSPEVAGAFQAAAQDPGKLKNAMDLATATLTRMGVRPDKQSVLPVNVAQNMAYEIQRDPSQAPAKLAQLRNQLGPTYFGKVLADLNHHGGLPVVYHAIASLPNQVAAASIANLIDGTRLDPKTGKIKVDVGNLIAEKDRGAIASGITNNPAIRQLSASMHEQGGSIPYTNEFFEAATLLAYSYKIENPGASDAQAVQAAVNGFTDHYRFLTTTGSARAPADKFDATVNSAEGMLQRLGLDNVQLPRKPDGSPIYGAGPGLNPPQEYIDGVMQAPHWVNSENGGWWYLKDWANRYVRDKNGNKIGLPIGGRPDLLPTQERLQRVPGEQVPTTAGEAAANLLLHKTVEP
jgi:hypothetical protein